MIFFSALLLFLTVPDGLQHSKMVTLLVMYLIGVIGFVVSIAGMVSYPMEPIVKPAEIYHFRQAVIRHPSAVADLIQIIYDAGKRIALHNPSQADDLLKLFPYVPFNRDKIHEFLINNPNVVADFLVLVKEIICDLFYKYPLIANHFFYKLLSFINNPLLNDAIEDYLIENPNVINNFERLVMNVLRWVPRERLATILDYFSFLC